jgi:hypothetical protein
MNNRGFGLIPMLMALAVGGIVIGGLATGITLMINSQKSVEVTRASKMIEDEMEMIVSTTEGCKSFLQGKRAPATAGTKRNITGTLRLTSGAVDVGRNLPLATGLVTDNLWLEGTGEDEVVGLTTGQRIRIVNLNLQVRKDMAGMFPPLSRPRTVRIHASVSNGSGAIQNCIAETPEVKACRTSGSVFNPSAPGTTAQCVPYDYCDWGGSYSTAPANRGGFNNQITGGRSCPTGYQPQTTGVIATAVNCGKNCVTNETSPVFTCMKCGGGINMAAGNTVPPTSIPIGDANDQLEEFDETQDIHAVQTYCLENNIPEDYCPWGMTTYPVWPSPTPAP